MTETAMNVRTTLRIPGNWTHPGELLERIPEGYQLTPDALILPDRTEIEFFPMPPDDQFAGIFRSSLRRPASAEELQVVDSYTVNVGLTGPGGSLASARAMMQAGAAIIQAGGAGVFIDNSALSHGAENWLFMTDEGSSDAVSFAFVGIIRGEHDVWTMGMQVPGFPEVVMRRADADADDRAIIEMIRYLCSNEKPVADGHIIADEQGPRFRAQYESNDGFDADSPMHNPFGRLRLVSMKDIAERN